MTEPPAAYVCDCCGGYFVAAWADADAIAEAQADFGVVDPVAAGFVQVCETCYREIRRWWELERGAWGSSVEDS